MDELPGGLTLFHYRTNQFKTISIRVVLATGLDPERATAVAMVPAVLERGTVGYPTASSLARRAEELYGARLSTDVLKVGEHQLVLMGIDIVDEQRLPGVGRLVEEAVQVLTELIYRPTTRDGCFLPEYVAGEADVMARRLESLANNKTSYALHRCIEEMCRGEAYATYRLGSLDRLAAIEPCALYQTYQNLLAHSPLLVGLVGDQPPGRVRKLLAPMAAMVERQVVPLAPTHLGKAPDVVKEVVEHQEVNQGKLVMGYRTGIALGDPRLPALVVYSGILGGFTHSKLFLNVRERASLAYYASSSLERHKGLLFIQSGIAPANYQPAREIIQEQVMAMAAGRISREEMEFTRAGLVSRLRQASDSPGDLMGFFLERIAAGSRQTLDEARTEIMQVTRDQVVEVAQSVRPDTVYFLSSKGGASCEPSIL
ncbi:MAG: pitrilysin family protein [Bacillota bacterium]